MQEYVIHNNENRLRCVQYSMTSKLYTWPLASTSVRDIDEYKKASIKVNTGILITILYT